jgi:hypothetical protein
VASAHPDRSTGRPSRTAAIGGLAFTVLYLLHRLLQGTGPRDPTAAAVAVGTSGGAFVAVGFASNAAETALVGVAGSDQPAAVVALDQLQGRTPVVWATTALATVVSLATCRTGLAGGWLGVAGLAAGAFFLLGSVFGVLGRTPRASWSLVGVALFVVWVLAGCVGLWPTAAPGAPARP